MSEKEDPCFLLETLWRMSIKIHQNLAEALERTPFIISSKSLIDSSLRLSSSVVNVIRDLSRILSCRLFEED